MPPQSKSNAPPLSECVVALSGTFPGFSQPALERDFLNPLGATLAKTVTKSTTHLVTNDADFQKPSTKVKQARSHDIPIVKLSWLEDCLEQNQHLDETAYAFDASGTSSQALAPASVNASIPSRKRTVIPIDDSDEDQKPAKKAKSVSSKGASQPQPQSQVAIPDSKTKSRISDGSGNVAKTQVVKVPMDEHCNLDNYTVYIDQDGVIYDASLNQTNSGNNNNKFYKIQVSDDHAVVSSLQLTIIL